MRPPLIRTDNPALEGRYGVANSAGPVERWPDSGDYPGFATLAEARAHARNESGAGWLGECWPVRYDYRPSPNSYNLTPARLARAERLAPGGVPRWVRIYDNGGVRADGGSVDRYTIVYTGKAAPERSPGRTEYPYRGASTYPFNPQGFGQYGACPNQPADTLGKKPGWHWPPAVGRRCHLGRRINFADLPPDVKRLCWQDYAAIWGVPMPLEYLGRIHPFRPEGHPLGQVVRCPHCHARGTVSLPAHPEDGFDCGACGHYWSMTDAQRARMRGGAAC